MSIEPLGAPNGAVTHEIATQISGWLSGHIARLLDLSPQNIDTDQTFARYGLDSASSIAMLGELGEYLGCELDTALVYDYPSIYELSRALAEHPQVRQAAIRRSASTGAPA